jgi:hypothetical protein
MPAAAALPPPDPGPGAELLPTPDRPGLWVSAAPNPRWPMHTSTANPARAAFACRCGLTRTAIGHIGVAALTADYRRHLTVCPLIPELPCQHCGQPTRARSSGNQGWPAHPECYDAWEHRVPAQRRREQQAKAIANRDRQRRNAARLRRDLIRRGYAPDLAAAIASGDIPTTDDDTTTS